VLISTGALVVAIVLGENHEATQVHILEQIGVGFEKIKSRVQTLSLSQRSY
jgi:hypothetical protein